MEQDSETGFYHTQFRQYYSSWGRWMSPDPAGMAAADPSNPQTWNRYAYVANNPTNATDPLGLRMCEISGVDCTRRGGGGGGSWTDGGGDTPVYQIDGIPISDSEAAQLFHMGAAAQCPNNDCTGVIFPENGYSELYRKVYNKNLTLNCVGTDFVNNPDYTCGWSHWSTQFVQNAYDALVVGDEARMKFIFGAAGQMADKPVKVLAGLTAVAMAPPVVTEGGPIVAAGYEKANEAAILAESAAPGLTGATTQFLQGILTSNPVTTVPGAVGRIIKIGLGLIGY
jgi:RHS repeat-associated protein